MSRREAENWRRFFLIRGPAGDCRLDLNFANLHRALIACHTGNAPPMSDLMLEFDYRRCFPKDIETAVAEMVENIDKDIETIVKRFHKT